LIRESSTVFSDAAALWAIRALVIDGPREVARLDYAAADALENRADHRLFGIELYDLIALLPRVIEMFRLVHEQDLFRPKSPRENLSAMSLRWRRIRAVPSVSPGVFTTTLWTPAVGVLVNTWVVAFMSNGITSALRSRTIS
jgi:hypothetical protein